MKVNNKSFTTFIFKLQKISKPVNAIHICSYIQEINKITYYKYYNSILNNTNFFLLNLPEKNCSFIALGNIFNYNKKFSRTNKLHIQHIHNFKKNKFNFYPLFVGGIKFPIKEKSNLWNDFPTEIWYVPEISFITYKNRYFFAFNFMFDDVINTETLNKKLKTIFRPQKNITESLNEVFLKSTTFNQWEKMVSTAFKKIESGELYKVVLARLKKRPLKTNINLKELIEKLKKENSECYVFCWKNNDSIFLGASPELLGKFSNNKFETDALAGSIRRGTNHNEDDLLANQLLNDKKNINEHNSVVNYLIHKLSEYSTSVTYDKTKIRKLKNIQHLWTPIKAKVRKNISIIELIKNIFPTPAICGLPKVKALKTIEQLENFDRGLYAGVMGWFNLNGNGEFFVSIRSALIKNSSLYLFAGSGIVEESEIKNEFEETELKFKTLMSIFKLNQI
ncbi:isochorismate synthase [Rosettibacter firmus]|uniref:isochorismate synthase n=1 Tax=Rosettibacter firmus TaxID=3111522 RepID=UPI00336BCF87